MCGQEVRTPFWPTHLFGWKFHSGLGDAENSGDLTTLTCLAVGGSTLGEASKEDPRLLPLFYVLKQRCLKEKRAIFSPPDTGLWLRGFAQWEKQIIKTKENSTSLSKGNYFICNSVDTLTPKMLSKTMELVIKSN